MECPGNAKANKKICSQIVRYNIISLLYSQLHRKDSETNKNLEESRLRSVGERIHREGGKKNRLTSELLQESEGILFTHISLASNLWDIGKQYSPICDAAERGVPSGAILFA